VMVAPYGGKLTVDPPVAPHRVLLRQSNDERGRSCRDGWPAGTSVWTGPALRDRVTVPPEHRGPAGRKNRPGKIIRRGQQDGTIRSDVTAFDIIVSGAMLACRSPTPPTARRQADIYQGGLPQSE
jgi:hypothetical protein